MSAASWVGIAVVLATLAIGWVFWIAAASLMADLLSWTRRRSQR